MSWAGGKGRHRPATPTAGVGVTAGTHRLELTYKPAVANAAAATASPSSAGNPCGQGIITEAGGGGWWLEGSFSPGHGRRPVMFGPLRPAGLWADDDAEEYKAEGAAFRPSGARAVATSALDEHWPAQPPRPVSVSCTLSGAHAATHS